MGTSKNSSAIIPIDQSFLSRFPPNAVYPSDHFFLYLLLHGITKLNFTSLHITTLRVVYDASEYIQRSVVNRLVHHAPLHRNRTRLAKSRYNGPRPRDLFRCWLRRPG